MAEMGRGMGGNGGGAGGGVECCERPLWYVVLIPISGEKLM